MEGQLTRYRLAPSVEVFPAPDGDVYLMRPGPGPGQALRRPTTAQREALTLLSRGPWDGAALAAAVGEPLHIVRGWLGELRAAGLALAGEPAPPLLDDHDRARFDRQLPYLDELAGRTGGGEALQRTLRDATVVILGCGGLGSWALAALASAGVGRFVLIDDDAVELSNLNRQVVYTRRDLGMLKVQAAARWVAAFDDRIAVEPVARRVTAPGDLAGALEGAGALVETADWPPYELARWVNEACVRAGVPFITAAQHPPIVRVGPLFRPGRGPCFECHERALRREFPLYDALTRHRAAEHRPAPTLGAASGVVGALIASEVQGLLLGASPATDGRAVVLDLQTLERRVEAVERDPRCPRCSASPL